MRSAEGKFAPTLACASVAVFLVALEMTVLAVALPAIAESFPDASRVALSWVFTTYNIGVAGLLLTAGWLAERFGRRRSFELGLGLFALGSLVCGFADSLAALLCGRAIQAAGGAMAVPASLALVLAAAPRGGRDGAIGVWGAMAGVAAALGPTLGALCVARLGWRWVFLANVPIALLAAAAAQRVVRESRGKVGRVDLLAVPLGAAGIGLLVFTIVAPRTLGPDHPGTALGGLAALACILGFAWRSLAHPAPVFDPAIARRRSFAASSLAMTAFVAAFSGWLVLAPSFLHEVWGYSLLAAGFAIAPAPLLMAGVARPAGRAVARFGHRRLVAGAGGLGVLACSFWLVRVGPEPGYWTDFFPGAVLIGIAVGVGFPMTTAASLRDVAPHQYAMGAAGSTTLRQISMAVGIALAVVCVGPAGSGLAGFRTSWFVCALLFAATSIVMLNLFPAERLAPSFDRPAATLTPKQEKLHV